MTKSEIERTLKQVEKDIAKDFDKNCDNECKECKYDIGDSSCRLVHSLYWLSDHDDIIKKFKSYKEDNKDSNKNKNNLKNREIYKSPEERIKAFRNFCKSAGNRCDNCMLKSYKNGTEQACMFQWLELEPNPSGEMATRLIEGIKKHYDGIITYYSFVKELFSPEHREEIKAIWARQDEENNNEK